jgi:hypothetical protein
LNPHKTSAFNFQVFISLLQDDIVYTLVDPVEEKLKIYDASALKSE